MSDLVEKGAGLGEPFAIERPVLLAALPGSTRQTSAGEHVQMLGDGLPRDLRPGSKLGDGQSSASRQPQDDAKTGFIAQRGEQDG